MPPLMCAGLRLEYGAQPILQGLDLMFDADASTAITGPSGSGKTSLLYCLSGLERRAQGSVRLLDHEIGDTSAERLADLRLREVGFVFQSADLVPELTLRQNIALPLELAGTTNRRVRARVDQLVAELGLGEAAERKPSSVSGGQAQRAAVARAVVARPRVVFADEPTGALDQHNRDAVLTLLLEQVRAIGGLLVTVTHDPEIAARFDRRIQLVDGRVVSDESAAV